MSSFFLRSIKNVLTSFSMLKDILTVGNCAISLFECRFIYAAMKGDNNFGFNSRSSFDGRRRHRGAKLYLNNCQCTEMTVVFLYFQKQTFLHGTCSLFKEASLNIYICISYISHICHIQSMVIWKLSLNHCWYILDITKKKI